MVACIFVDEFEVLLMVAIMDEFQVL